jgi:hypothetical protein
MGQILCPMCGRNCHESIFDPNSLDHDIYIREEHGLGRGLGFSYGPHESVLGDDIYSPQILERCFSLIQLFIDNDLLTKEELMDRFDLISIINKKYLPCDYHNIIIKNLENIHKKKSEELKRQINNLKINNSILEEEKTKMKKEIVKKEVIEKVIKILSNVFNVERKLLDENMIIEIEEVNKKGIVIFCRELYKLDRKLRKEVVKRIHCKENVFGVIRDYMMNEPVIRSVIDVFLEKPSRLYHVVQRDDPSFDEIINSLFNQADEDSNRMQIKF